MEILILYLLAAAALQASSASGEYSDAGCIAAVAATAEKPGASAGIVDPELIDRARIFAAFSGTKAKQSGRSAQDLRRAIDIATEDVRADAMRSADSRSFYQAKVDHCRTVIEKSLAAEAARLTLSEQELPLVYLRCTIIYAMTYGVAFRAESEGGRYGARMTKMFEKLYGDARFTEGMDEQAKRSIRQRDYQTVEAEEQRRGSGPEQCVLLAVKEEAKQ